MTDDVQGKREDWELEASRSMDYYEEAYVPLAREQGRRRTVQACARGAATIGMIGLGHRGEGKAPRSTDHCEGVGGLLSAGEQGTRRSIRAGAPRGLIETIRLGHGGEGNMLVLVKQNP